jgi:hypothetical protein
MFSREPESYMRRTGRNAFVIVWGIRVFCNSLQDNVFFSKSSHPFGLQNKTAMQLNFFCAKSYILLR